VTRSRAGFTVLEAAVALAIVGVATVGVLGALGAQTRALETARSQLEASALAESMLERLRIADRASLDVLPDSIRRGRFGPPFGAYTWVASTEPVRNERDLMDLSVRVTGPSSEFELRTRRHFPTAVLLAR
jgi:type II secretory pathway pseudopilin PulG